MSSAQTSTEPVLNARYFFIVYVYISIVLFTLAHFCVFITETTLALCC